MHPEVRSQRVEEFVVGVTDSGPNAITGEITADDVPIIRTVFVRGGSAHDIDILISLLPPDFPFCYRVDDFTCAIGGTERFLRMTVEGAFQHVDNMLLNASAIMHAYLPNFERRYGVWQVHHVHKSLRQSAQRRFSLTISDQDGLAALRAPADGDLTLATLLLHLAQTNGKVGEALALLNAPNPGWAAVYDTIKLVERTSVAKGKATKLKLYRGTASWYRHLGELGRPKKPAGAPTLVQARTFAFGLLRVWLELRVSEYIRRRDAGSTSPLVVVSQPVTELAKLITGPPLTMQLGRQSTKQS